MLDVAPTRRFIAHLRMPGRTYVGMDLDPNADDRPVTTIAGLTNLPFGDGVIDLAIVSHVLEHIPDDRAAMSELARVLSPTGRAIVQVPWRNGPTTEDPLATAAERTRRFGQADHVRRYGSDFEDRLKAAGLCLVRTTPGELLGEDEIEIFGLSSTEPVWILRPSADGIGREDATMLEPFAGLAPPLLPDLAGVAIATLLRQVDELKPWTRSLRESRTAKLVVRIRRRIRRLALKRSTLRYRSLRDSVPRS